MTDTSVLHMTHGHDGDGRCIAAELAAGQTRPAGDAPNPGVARCPCCGDDHYGPTLLCGECREFGCEATDHGYGEGLGYWYCGRTDSSPLADCDEAPRFARYESREIAVTFYNGAGYVVRSDQYPHTTWPAGRLTTLQGNARLVGCRQGTSDRGGFKVTRYTLPDTFPW